jgi:hypothetical protein
MLLQEAAPGKTGSLGNGVLASLVFRDGWLIWNAMPKSKFPDNGVNVAGWRDENDGESD